MSQVKWTIRTLIYQTDFLNNILKFLLQSRTYITIKHPVMALNGVNGVAILPSLKNVKKCPKNQNIALFHRNSTNAMASCRLHLNFRKKIGRMYAIESDNLFLKITLVLGRKIKTLVRDY